MNGLPAAPEIWQWIRLARLQPWWAWASDGSFGTDTSDASIQGQRYDNQGNPIGAEFQINTYTTDTQDAGAITMDAEGDFLVLWMSYGGFGF